MKKHNEYNLIIYNTLLTKIDIKYIKENISKDGLIYVYGKTEELINYAIELNKEFIFKYWIILDNETKLGLLLYSKSKDLTGQSTENINRQCNCLFIL